MWSRSDAAAHWGAVLHGFLKPADRAVLAGFRRLPCRRATTSRRQPRSDTSTGGDADDSQTRLAAGIPCSGAQSDSHRVHIDARRPGILAIVDSTGKVKFDALAMCRCRSLHSVVPDPADLRTLEHDERSGSGDKTASAPAVRFSVLRRFRTPRLRPTDDTHPFGKRVLSRRSPLALVSATSGALSGFSLRPALLNSRYFRYAAEEVRGPATEC
jgi:hypothetical protein